MRFNTNEFLRKDSFSRIEALLFVKFCQKMTKK